MNFGPVFLVFVLLLPSCAVSDQPDSCDIGADADPTLSRGLCAAVSLAAEESGLEEIDVQIHQLDNSGLETTLTFSGPHGLVSERIAMRQWDKGIDSPALDGIARGLIQAALRVSQ